MQHPMQNPAYWPGMQFLYVCLYVYPSYCTFCGNGHAFMFLLISARQVSISLTGGENRENPQTAKPKSIIINSPSELNFQRISKFVYLMVSF